MSASFDLTLAAPDGTCIPVRVTHKRVKNLNLKVRRDGSVVMSIPLGCPVSTAEAFLRRKASWIAERVREREACEAKRAAARETRPDTVPLWGTRVDAAKALGCDVDELRALSPEAFDARVEKLYREEVKRALPAVVRRVEEATGVHATRWSVRAMKTRWGSCTPKTGAIRIALRLAAYPPACLEFVVTHELVHLMEPSHNARFHALLDRFCPDNRKLAALLKHSPVEG